MYRHALKRKADLDLNEVETFDTRVSAKTNLLMALVLLFSVAVAIIFHGSWLAGMLGGFVYMLYPVIMIPFGFKTDRERKALLAKIGEQAQPNPD